MVSNFKHLVWILTWVLDFLLLLILMLIFDTYFYKNFSTSLIKEITWISFNIKVKFFNNVESNWVSNLTELQENHKEAM